MASTSGAAICEKTIALHAADHMNRGSVELTGVESSMAVFAGMNHTWPRVKSVLCCSSLPSPNPTPDFGGNFIGSAIKVGYRICRIQMDHTPFIIDNFPSLHNTTTVSLYHIDKCGSRLHNLRHLILMLSYVKQMMFISNGRSTSINYTEVLQSPRSRF